MICLNCGMHRSQSHSQDSQVSPKNAPLQKGSQYFRTEKSVHAIKLRTCKMSRENVVSSCLEKMFVFADVEKIGLL